MQKTALFSLENCIIFVRDVNAYLDDNELFTLRKINKNFYQACHEYQKSRVRILTRYLHEQIDVTINGLPTNVTHATGHLKYLALPCDMDILCSNINIHLSVKLSDNDVITILSKRATPFGLMKFDVVAQNGKKTEIIDRSQTRHGDLIYIRRKDEKASHPEKPPHILWRYKKSIVWTFVQGNLDFYNITDSVSYLTFSMLMHGKYICE